MPSAGGRFYSVYPLYDGTNRMLVSWAPCLIQTTAGTTEVCNSIEHDRRERHAGAAAVHRLDLRLRRRHPEPAAVAPSRASRSSSRSFCRRATPVPTYIPGLHAEHRGPANPGQQRGRHPQHLERLRLRRGRHGEAEHRHAGESRAGELLHAPGPLRAHRKGGRNSAQDGAQDRPGRLRARRHGHARNPGLRARAAGRLGADPGAGARAVHHRCARRECPAHHRAAHELDAADAGRDQDLQRLPHRGQSQDPLARPRRPDGGGQPGSADHRRAVPRHV